MFSPVESTRDAHPSALELAFCLLLLVAWSFPAQLCAAEPEPPARPSPEYERVIEQAVREYRFAHFPEARALFSRANELYPNARALRGLGMAEFELRSYVESALALRRALACQVKPLEGELRERAEELLRRAEGFVGRFELVSDARELSVSVDGTPTALDGSVLTLAVGDHDVMLTAPGHTAQRRTVRVRGGEHETLSVEFADAQPRGPLEVQRADVDKTAGARSANERDASTSRDSSGDKPWHKRAWLWTAIGVAAAATAAGLAYGLRDRSAETRDPIAEWPAATLPGP